VNFQGDQVVRVGTVDSDGAVAYDPRVKLQYMGGSKAPDAPARTLVPIARSVRVGLSVATVFVSLLVLAGLFLLYLLRAQPVFKAASPVFVASMLGGVLLLVSSMWPRILENAPGSSRACVADVFLANCTFRWHGFAKAHALQAGGRMGERASGSGRP
jgi:hypothetical protein